MIESLSMWNWMFLLMPSLGVLVTMGVVIWLRCLWFREKVYAKSFWTLLILMIGAIFCLNIPIAFTTMSYAQAFVGLLMVYTDIGPDNPCFNQPELPCTPVGLAPTSAISDQTKTVASFELVIRNLIGVCRCHFSDPKACRLADAAERYSITNSSI